MYSEFLAYYGDVKGAEYWAAAAAVAPTTVDAKRKLPQVGYVDGKDASNSAKSAPEKATIEETSHTEAPSDRAEVGPGNTGDSKSTNISKPRPQKHTSSDSSPTSIDGAEAQENILSVQEEVEALRCIYGEDKVSWTGGGQGIRIDLDCTVDGIFDESSSTAQASPSTLRLDIDIFETYPSRSPPGFRLSADWLSAHDATHATNALLDIAASEPKGSQLLFPWCEWLREHVNPPSDPSQTSMQTPTQTSTQSAQAPTRAMSGRPEQPQVLGRRLIYSHHIIARSKRDAVRGFAKDMGVSGMSKIGWPGAIIVEGPEEAVCEYVSCLRRLHWKHLAVRGEEIIKISPGASGGIDAIRKLPKDSFVEFGENQMSEFAAACRRVGLEDLFLTLIKKNSKQKCGGGGLNKISPSKDIGSRKSSSKSGQMISDSDTRQWAHGDLFVDRKSTFQAHVIRVASKDDVTSAMEILLNDSKIARATHNISAQRFFGSQDGGRLHTDCDDDGETAAGGRLLRLLNLTKVSQVLVVVSRWYGGVHLGPDRFRHINNVARALLVRQGFVPQSGESDGKKKNKKSKKGSGGDAAAVGGKGRRKRR